MPVLGFPLVQPFRQGVEGGLNCAHGSALRIQPRPMLNLSHESIVSHKYLLGAN